MDKMIFPTLLLWSFLFMVPCLWDASDTPGTTLEQQLLQTVKELPPHSGCELCDQAEGSCYGEGQVVGEDDVEVTQPLHAAKVTQQVKVGDA